jgi:hypothetical protein
VGQIPDAVDRVVCAPDDGWKYHPKHVEQFPDIDKLCNVASCWIYIGILLGAQYILHISRIRIKLEWKLCVHKGVQTLQYTIIRNMKTEQFKNDIKS